uniref:Lipid scramblase CLPTM1L n=1 Tax=Strigamia maritima TaxID=126957 RepID=T1ITR1_STRMM
MKPSWGSLFFVAFLAYVLNSVWTLYQLWRVPPCVDDYCLTSSLKSIENFKLHFYQSPTRNPRRKEDLNELYVWDNFDILLPQERSINVTMLNEAVTNKTVYLHIVMVPQYTSVKNPITLITNPLAATAVGALVTYMIPEKRVFNILNSEMKIVNQNKMIKEQPTAHWRTKMIFEIVTDKSSLPSRNMPRELIKFIRMAPRNEYLPVLFINKMKYRITDLQPINKSETSRELLLKYNPTSFGMLRLLVQLQGAMTTMKNLGFEEKDIDEVKGIFTDTNLYLLCATFVIAAFHLMFDFLAFKNDIAFWKRKKSMVGVSFRTVSWRCISQIIIFLHLWDEEASRLILIPAFIGTFIEVWKVLKASKISIHWKFPLPKLLFGSTNDAEKKSEEFDAEVMKHLRYFVYPLCLGGAIYSLVYVEHKSLFSWCLQSLVNGKQVFSTKTCFYCKMLTKISGVYAFGFLLMLPQLFLNYKLKSVAHLPWKVFMYKAFNTFIDDIFAFIITMPTAHRIACFRDDIVFLIYLYQRWLYPVDKTRENEYGENFTEEKKQQ